jgi:hypothetical protein
MFADDDQLTFLIRRWANGDSAVPAVRRLVELGSHSEAATLARRVAIRAPIDALDEACLADLINEAGSPPAGWSAALEAFAATPSDEGWEELMRFVPEDVFYQRLKNTIVMLQTLHCDGDALFRCASRGGMMPELFELATSGTVDPETIAARAIGSGAAPAWLGLAAQAALARNDRFGVIRYLRAAMQNEETAYLAWTSIGEIREEADEELNEQLDKVGVPWL